jgi:hypothetical protein
MFPRARGTPPLPSSPPARTWNRGSHVSQRPSVVSLSPSVSLLFLGVVFTFAAGSGVRECSCLYASAPARSCLSVSLSFFFFFPGGGKECVSVSTGWVADFENSLVPPSGEEAGFRRLVLQASASGHGGRVIGALDAGQALYAGELLRERRSVVSTQRTQYGRDGLRKRRKIEYMFRFLIKKQP